MPHRTFIIILTTLVVMASSESKAQVFYGGLQLGINGSQIWGDQMSGFNKGGVLAGVFIDFPVTKRVYFFAGNELYAKRQPTND